MKKLSLFSVLAILIVHVSFAQNISFGVKGGLNIVNAKTSIPVVESGKTSRNLLHGGVIMDIGISEHFSVQPQLLYNGKGVKFDAGAHDHIITLHSVDLPIYAVYKITKGIYVGGGPNFGVNVKGKNVATGALNETKDYKFNKDPFEFKRFDFGLNAVVGYQHTSGLFISANYLKGMSKNLINAPAPGAEWSHNVLAFSIGYLFSQKSKAGLK